VIAICLQNGAWILLTKKVKMRRCDGCSALRLLGYKKRTVPMIERSVAVSGARLPAGLLVFRGLAHGNVPTIRLDSVAR
jgi:hypothetical protein